MKYTLFLLAAITGAACGSHLDARISGVTTIGDPCTTEVEEELYQVCVEDLFVSMGGELDRRLELRGSRRLSCDLCEEQHMWLGHWCFSNCQRRRRLAIADEQRFLVSEEELQQAATECYVRKMQEGYECLGNPEDLTVSIFLSE
jgi:hypothetical protein